MKLSEATRARERPQRYPLPAPQQAAPPRQHERDHAAAYADELAEFRED